MAIDRTKRANAELHQQKSRTCNRAARASPKPALFLFAGRNGGLDRSRLRGHPTRATHFDQLGDQLGPGLRGYRGARAPTREVCSGRVRRPKDLRRMRRRTSPWAFLYGLGNEANRKKARIRQTGPARTCESTARPLYRKYFVAPHATTPPPARRKSHRLHPAALAGRAEHHDPLRNRGGGLSFRRKPFGHACATGLARPPQRDRRHAAGLGPHPTRSGTRPTRHGAGRPRPTRRRHQRPAQPDVDGCMEHPTTEPAAPLARERTG